MPTAIEQGYFDQGYILPVGWTWERVAEHRARWDTDAIMVPLVVHHGVVGWGVPIVDGAYLKRPPTIEKLDFSPQTGK